MLPRRGDDREGGGGQEAAEPAVADMVGQRHRRVADPRREQLDQQRRDRPVDHGHIEHEQEQDRDDQRPVDLRRSRLGRIAGLGRAALAERLRLERLRARHVDRRTVDALADRGPRPCCRRRGDVGVGDAGLGQRRTWPCRSRCCRTWSCRSDRTGTSSRRDRRRPSPARSPAPSPAPGWRPVSALNSGK